MYVPMYVWLIWSRIQTSLFCQIISNFSHHLFSDISKCWNIYCIFYFKLLFLKTSPPTWSVNFWTKIVKTWINGSKKKTTHSMLTSGLTTGMLSRILCLLRCLKMSSLSLEVKLHGCWVIWSISRHLYKTSWLEIE